jgi:hypothetical protein
LPFVGLPPAYGLTVAAVSVAGMGLGAQLVAAFSEAHRYKQIVAAVSKSGLGTGPWGLSVSLPFKCHTDNNSVKPLFL